MKVHRTGRSADKAERILTVAEDLVLRRGFRGVTIADIAERAHVGKGTVYLYWETKEDVFLELIAREIHAALEQCIAAVTSDPALAAPDRLCPHLIRIAMASPLVRALQTQDAGLLGAILDHPRSAALLEGRGAAALIKAMLPVWREHGMVRTDLDPDVQLYGLQILALGHVEAQIRTRPAPTTVTTEDAFAVAVRAMLAVPDISPATVEVVAAKVLAVMRAAIGDS